MESRFERQLKKGALEMLVLGLVCAGPTYGYELLGTWPAQQRAFCAEGRHVVSHFVPAGRRWAYRSAMAYQPGAAPHRKNTTRPRRRVMRLMPVQRKAWRALRGLRGRI